MSFGIAILLPEKQLLLDKYSRFLYEIAQTGGEWRVLEHSPIDPNADETVHDCVLVDRPRKRSKERKNLSVWITLAREEHTKKYGRSRKKIHWMIYLETKAGRSFWDLAVQMMIPLKAFAMFSDIVVLVNERIFLQRNNYKQFATRELVTEFGKQALKEKGLLDVEGLLSAEVTLDAI